MAKYDTTKFYWLQLKEDFFDEDAIDWLEEQPNGKEYSLFYLKLCLKSLRTNGVLIRRVGNMLVPYDHVKLGELTKTNPDTVMVAMNLLINIGLVQKLENGELYLTQVEHMIGSQSKSAFKKQQQRLTRKKTAELPEGEKKAAELPEGGQEVDKCPPDIEKEKEVELEREQEKEDKIDKIDKSDFSLSKPNSLTKKLIEIKYIEPDDICIDEYNKVFYEIIDNYGFEIARSCLWYFVNRYKTNPTDEEGNEIGNKLAYFRVSMTNGAERLERDNSRDTSRVGGWLYEPNDAMATALKRTYEG